MSVKKGEFSKLENADVSSIIAVSGGPGRFDSDTPTLHTTKSFNQGPFWGLFRFPDRADLVC